MPYDYFSDFRMRFSTDSYTTDWINLENRIAMGCTISPILFVIAMEVILKAAEDSAGPANLAKCWSKAEGKEERDKVINEIRLNEDSRRVQKAVQQPQQGQQTNWDNALLKSLTWNGSATWRHFGSAFSSDQCTISCPPMQIWYGRERKRIPLVRYAKAISTAHVLSFCKIALSPERCKRRSACRSGVRASALITTGTFFTGSSPRTSVCDVRAFSFRFRHN
ncbi:hypothetical protein RRG08_000717 [Elysia crispata]|uniref:Uncharacterized protein n=1 Tax=Elysia crispata TaxID=231223 RepID=A0AAE1E5V4_9GAST|nr:hypothetical protein RRG08_000717 [Elysia crispata]